ncbi:hypothetical protein CCR97_09140 [Rhodoplanes elegans]|uniref:Uncharacterized protein n=1 Tax=Rhodoplanes elegans TaxID=29408 RepID=A0A327KAY5_9BRAD|nr:hypothetical protein [Rhodoplanes elegans]MBK5958373.1 hypothetical protein [Rhodoplanes elegans]RAI32458.1 hypothetical protein CH338_24120 [Rhodoplanes elegans]
MSFRLPSRAHLANMMRVTADEILWAQERYLRAQLDDEGFVYDPPGRAYYRGLIFKRLKRIEEIRAELFGTKSAAA